MFHAVETSEYFACEHKMFEYKYISILNVCELKQEVLLPPYTNSTTPSRLQQTSRLSLLTKYENTYKWPQTLMIISPDLK